MSISDDVKNVETRYQAVVQKKNRIEGELSSKEQERTKLHNRREEIMKDLNALGIYTEAELTEKIKSLSEEINGVITTVEQKFQNAGI